MRSKEFLLQIKKLNRLIENKLIEVQQLKDIASNATSNMSGEQVPSGKSGNTDKIANAICAYMDLENEINHDIDELIDKKKAVVSVIEQLNATEYDVLHKVYVQSFTLQEVATRYDRAYSWATTIHGRALKHVQNILDEREKDEQR